MSPSRASAFSEDLKPLVDAYVWAVSEYGRMLSAQIAAIRKGEPARFDRELEAAREHLESVRTLIRARLPQDNPRQA